MRALFLIAFALAGCSGSIEIGRPPRPPPIVAPPGATVIEEPDGSIVETPAAIETVITGLSQAQQVRTLTRQLAR